MSRDSAFHGVEKYFGCADAFVENKFFCVNRITIASLPASTNLFLVFYNALLKG